MLLAPYYNETDGLLSVSRQQGSDFAKALANDFNPLHDVDARRFVVPGDLLFSLILQKMGISAKMRFEFVGMMSADSEFSIVEEGANGLNINVGEKLCTKIQRSGEVLSDAALIEAISLEYVKFSGKTFPAILLPLMQQENVMINPSRPMVMYQSMVIELNETAFSNPTIELAKQEINVDGKRGDVAIHFNILADGKVVGCGEKHFLLSGLRPFETDAMGTLVKDYEATKDTYLLGQK